MAFPCCMGLTVGIRLAAILSIVLALGMAGVSGWLLKETHEDREAFAVKVINLWDSVVGNAAKIDVDQVLRIKLWCSATVLAAAVLQLLTSSLLLFCSFFKGGHATGRLYVFINLFVLLAIAGALGCFLTTEIDYQSDNHKSNQVKIFMGVSGVDFLFLIYLLVVAGFYIRSS